MGRSAGRPGLIGRVAKTAVVAGTATAVAGVVHRHQEQKSADQQQPAESQQQQQAAAAKQPPAQRAPTDESDRLAKIKELGEMKDQGLLTDSEFASEKARLLAT